MSDNGPTDRRVFPVLLTDLEADLCDLALRKMALMAETAGEHEAWSLASALAARFRKAAGVKEWT